MSGPHCGIGLLQAGYFQTNNIMRSKCWLMRTKIQWRTTKGNEGISKLVSMYALTRIRWWTDGILVRRVNLSVRRFRFWLLNGETHLSSHAPQNSGLPRWLWCLVVEAWRPISFHRCGLQNVEDHFIKYCLATIPAEIACAWRLFEQSRSLK